MRLNKKNSKQREQVQFYKYYIGGPNRTLQMDPVKAEKSGDWYMVYFYDAISNYTSIHESKIGCLLGVYEGHPYCLLAEEDKQRAMQILNHEKEASTDENKRYKVTRCYQSTCFVDARSPEEALDKAGNIEGSLQLMDEDEVEEWAR